MLCRPCKQVRKEAEQCRVYKKRGEVRKRKRYEISVTEQAEEAKKKKLCNYKVITGCQNCRKKCHLNFDKTRRFELKEEF